MTQTRKLGDADVFPIGLGGMPMSLSSRPPEEQAIRTIHAALDAGVNLIDTADAYCRDASDVGHNERLIAKALRGRRDGVIVATKGGHTRAGRPARGRCRWRCRPSRRRGASPGTGGSGRRRAPPAPRGRPCRPC